MQEVFEEEVLVGGPLLLFQQWLAGHRYLCNLSVSPCSLPRWTNLGFLPIWLLWGSLSADSGWGSRVSAPPVMKRHFCDTLLAPSESLDEGY